MAAGLAVAHAAGARISIIAVDGCDLWAQFRGKDLEEIIALGLNRESIAALAGYGIGLEEVQNSDFSDKVKV